MGIEHIVLWATILVLNVPRGGHGTQARIGTLRLLLVTLNALNLDNLRVK